MVTIISTATIGGSNVLFILYLPTKFGLVMSWNGQDIERPVNGTQ